MFYGLLEFSLFFSVFLINHYFSGTSVLESMWSSMSSSMQLAKDCLEKEGISTTTMGQPLEGLEHFAQTIDSSKNFYHSSL